MNFGTIKCVAVIAGSLAGPAALAGTTVSGDFNGDGFADLAIGVPDEAVGSILGAGAVNVIYGSATGLNATTPIANQFWHQDKGGIEDDCEASDGFGSALAAGDFNGDGYCDLAIGVPGEDQSNGAVNVIYGSATGLKSAGDQIWRQSSLGGLTGNHPAQLFGATLAVGDFNNDGRDDLAIGAPFDSESGIAFSGDVIVLYGTATGLKAANAQKWNQTATGKDISESHDRFGMALAVGDFNNDGFDDLAVGSPGEAIGAKNNVGAVHILLGSANRLTATGAQFWHQNSVSALDACEVGDEFGFALAAGDFDGDGFDDLAVGVPGEAVVGGANAGAVQVFYGMAAGIDASRDQFWHQDTANILEQVDPAEAGEAFGSALAAGFFNNDRFCDLAIGAPGEDLGAASEAGIVHVLYGRAAGLRHTNNQIWSQDSGGIADKAEESDRFGAALGTGDFNGDGRMDLVIAAPGESIGTKTSCGAITVIYGGATKFVGAGSQLWHQNRPDILDKCEVNDGFGGSLAP